MRRGIEIVTHSGLRKKKERMREERREKKGQD